eukprot:Nk52_evm11s266 gene=Nk52_evmTU11s266
MGNVKEEEGADKSTSTWGIHHIKNMIRHSMDAVYFSSLHRDVQIGLIGGFGCAVGQVFTNGFDVCKVRLQKQNLATSTLNPTTHEPFVTHYKNTYDAFNQIWKTEGLRGLNRGLTGAVLREMTYSSLRIGFYEPTRNIISSIDLLSPVFNHPVTLKLTAGLISGSLAALLSNPVDVIKTRMQAGTGPRPPYRTTFHGLAHIARHEGWGLNGLWKGVGPTVVRAALHSCAQVGSYDIIKNNILVPLTHINQNIHSNNGNDEDENDLLKKNQHPALHIVASILAALITTTATTPVDVVKTRIQTMKSTSSSAAANNINTPAPPPAPSAIRVAAKMVREEGPLSLMKGWTPAYLRFGPHTIVAFVIIEQLRGIAGLDAL